MSAPENNPVTRQACRDEHRQYRAYMKVSDLTAFTGIAPNTVYKWVKQGRIKTVEFGSRILIPADEMERLLTEGVPTPNQYRDGDAA